MTDSNDEVVTTTEQVIEEVVQQPTTTAANITTSDDKTVKNDDIDFSVVDALPPQLNKGAESEEVSKSVEKGAKVVDEDSKKKDDNIPFSQLFRYASPVDK